MSGKREGKGVKGEVLMVQHQCIKAFSSLSPSDLGEAIARQLKVENICDPAGTGEVRPQEKKCINTYSHLPDIHVDDMSVFLLLYSVFH